MKLTKTQQAEAMIAHDLYWESYLKAEIKALSSSLKNQYSQLGLGKAAFCSKKEIGQWAILEEQLTGDIKLHNRTSKIKSVDGFVFFKEQCDLYVFKEFEWTLYSKFKASSLMQKKDYEWKMIHHQFSMPKGDIPENQCIQKEEFSEVKVQTRELIKK